MLHYQNEMSSSGCRFNSCGRAGANALGLVSFSPICVQTDILIYKIEKIRIFMDIQHLCTVDAGTCIGLTWVLLSALQLTIVVV